MHIMILAIFFVAYVLMVDGKTVDKQESWQIGADELTHDRSRRGLVKHWENVLTNGACGFPLYTCPQSGVCLYSLIELCDGKNNCHHGEDEQHCSHGDIGALEFIRNTFEVTTLPTTVGHAHIHNIYGHHHHHHQHVTTQVHSTHANHNGAHSTHASHNGGLHFAPVTNKPSTTSKTTFAPTQRTSTVTPHWIKFTQSTVPSIVILPLMG